MKRIESLEGLRAMAFFSVFFAHIGVYKLACLGPFGVSIFFVLSGFVLFLSGEKKMSSGELVSVKWDYATRKLSRLYPLHVATFLFQFLMPIFFSVKNHTPLEEGFFRPAIFNITLLHSWFSPEQYHFSFNGVAWYLSTTVFLYFSFPLLFRIVHPVKKRRTLILGMLGVYLAQLYVMLLLNAGECTEMFKIYIVYVCPFFRLGCFSIGVMLSKLFLLSSENDSKLLLSATRNIENAKEKPALNSFFRQAFALFILLVIIAALVIFERNILPQYFTFSLIFTPPVAILVYLVAEKKTFLSRLLENKFLLFIAKGSAYYFLIHQIVSHEMQRVINHFGGLGVMTKPARALTAFILTLILTKLWLIFWGKISSTYEKVFLKKNAA